MKIKSMFRKLQAKKINHNKRILKKKELTIFFALFGKILKQIKYLNKKLKTAN